ncbi:MAG: TetR/AcrR family transcriptional regulator [Pseudomonadota bacterium]
MATAKTRDKILDSFLTLLKTHPYGDVTLSKIADEAGVKLSVLREAYDGKIALIEEFARKIDAAVLDDIDEDVADELPRERLMDVLLSRFDALGPHKEVIRTMLAEARNDLAFAAKLNRITLVSMTWMLNAANINTGGMDGALRVQGTAMVFAKVLRTWVDDDESMAKTMAKLDKELRSGERMMKRMDRMSSMMAPLKRFKTRKRARQASEETAV